MSVLSFVQILRGYFLFATVGFVFINGATSCEKKYPSEYAYRDDSVTRDESIIANCRNYPSGPQQQEQYIYCNGIQLKLTDDDLGPEQFMINSRSHYQWSAGSTAQLLFIFPTRVSLTAITLHYYSDSVRGLPRLAFYAVPDDFDVWDPPRISYPFVEVASVPSGGEPGGHRSISINVNFNTLKVLMYKDSSSFMFAVSEVEFFACITTYTTELDPVTSTYSDLQTLPSTTTIVSASDMTDFSISLITTTTEGSTEEEQHSNPALSSNKQIQCRIGSNSREIVAWVLVVILVVLLSMSLTINGVQAVWAHRKSNKTNHDASPDCALAMDSNPCYEASIVK